MSIKSWWKSLFREPDVTMPEVKPCKPEKDISEPVLSFIEVYKANPKRFKINFEQEETEEFIKHSYSLHDKQQNLTFKVSVKQYYGWSHRNWTGGLNATWATDEEIRYVYGEIRDERLVRHAELKGKRDKRARERLTKLYKGE